MNLRCFALIALALLLCALPLNAFAAELSSMRIDSAVVGSAVVQKMFIKSDSSSLLEFALPLDATAISVSRGKQSVDFSETDQLSSRKISFEAEQGKEYMLSFVSNSFVEPGNGKNFFIFNLVPDYNISSFSFSIALEEGVLLEKSINSGLSKVSPKSVKVSSTGRAITLEWSFLNLKKGESIPFFVSFEKKQDVLFSPGIAVLVIILLLAFGYWKRDLIFEKFTSENKHVFDESKYLGLTDDELSVLKCVESAGSKGIIQIQLLSKTGLNKVKLSRVIDRLLRKGYLKKIPYGNTNLIVFLKKDL